MHLFFKQRPHQILWRKSVIVFYSDDHVAFIYPKPYGWPVSLSLTFVLLSLESRNGTLQQEERRKSKIGFSPESDSVADQTSAAESQYRIQLLSLNHLGKKSPAIAASSAVLSGCLPSAGKAPRILRTNGNCDWWYTFIVGYSYSLNDHVSHLRTVFQVLRKNHLYVNKERERLL